MYLDAPLFVAVLGRGGEEVVEHRIGCSDSLPLAQNIPEIKYIKKVNNQLFNKHNVIQVIRIKFDNILKK